MLRLKHFCGARCCHGAAPGGSWSCDAAVVGGSWSCTVAARLWGRCQFLAGARRPRISLFRVPVVGVSCEGIFLLLLVARQGGRSSHLACTRIRRLNMARSKQNERPGSRLISAEISWLICSSRHYQLVVITRRPSRNLQGTNNTSGAGWTQSL